MAAPNLVAAGGLGAIETLIALVCILFWIVSKIRSLVRFLGGGQEARPAARPGRPPVDDEERRELMRRVEALLRESASGQPATAPTQRRRPAAVPPLPGSRPLGLPGRGSAPRRPAAKEKDAGRLGSLGGHATDVARHVDGAFAHELEHLPAGLARPVASTPAAAPALDLAALVRNPATLRQLVIVREVLERPVDRW